MDKKHEEESERPRDDQSKNEGDEIKQVKENKEAMEEAVNHPPPEASGEDF